ncbi:short-chain dehydrogenase [Patellaria atrata CBS 101060]|uniref:Short-chain dehydrogenase n=1 Tax=Patellaria atrata CBS 101060 TaxID=1346257 RepID=A0A9P4SCX3_9PEZI|nr:short-chain dehydrogenase [Patellaria atrata CBS 101060]
MPQSEKYRDANINRTGPGDARPTALQIVRDAGVLGKLNDKVALITGCTSGIGIETARALHETGATVFITGKDASEAQKVANEIINKEGSNKAPIHVLEFDLASLESVRKGAKEFLSQSDRLNILVNNAGVMRAPEGRSVDGYETQFATNHLGHFLLFQLLKDTLLASSTPEFNSRVVVVASTGHRYGQVRFDDYNFEKDPYDPGKAYGQSKTANIYFACAVERKYGLKGLHALSLHPGAIKTGIQKYTPEAEPLWELPAIKKYTKTPEQGAATTVYAAVSPDWEGKGGRYIVDCEEVELYKGVDKLGLTDQGYAKWIYDEEAEERVWKDSNKMVGLEEEA